jgi:D-amino-acid oxidase
LVIGAGVSGLSCAIRLAELGWHVRVLAREVSPHTTSDVPAAIWYPYQVGPRERAVRWGIDSLAVFTSLCADESSGVRMTEYLEAHRTPVARPWWADMTPSLRLAAAEELPAGCACGFVVCVPLVEMSIYMPWLMERLHRAGGVVEVGSAESIDDVVSPDHTVINCTGLGARTFAHDPALYPIRGQVVRIRRPAQITRGVSDDSIPGLPTYVIPRREDCFLGSAAQRDDWDTSIRDEDARSILDRCIRLMPSLGAIEVIDHRVGLRPGRAEIRLEMERRAGGAAVHNYGHGGAGVTLSWGCAIEVAEIAARIASHRA